MATYVIPTTSDPSAVQVTDLGGTDFELTFSWLERDLSWRLDLRTLAGDDVALGLVLVPSRLLLERVGSEDRPEGELVCVGSESRISRAALGDGSAQLLYVDGDDLTALRAEIGR
jgi:hypothetical protein